MLDKYFILMFLVAANTVGTTVDELTISYIQYPVEWTTEGIREQSFENVSLMMTKESGKIWEIEDVNRNQTQQLEILKSEVTLKGEAPIRLKYDWVDFRDFRYTARDTIYSVNDKSPILEILQNSNQKIMEIRILDKEKSHQIGDLLIKYD